MDLESAIGRLPDGSRQVFIPVSYTHLRAHETVLDLVCRLMLETNTIKSVDTRHLEVEDAYIEQKKSSRVRYRSPEAQQT